MLTFNGLVLAEGLLGENSSAESLPTSSGIVKDTRLIGNSLLPTDNFLGEIDIDDFRGEVNSG